MTAPKLIWAAPWKDCDGEWPEGDWDTHEGRTLDKPCARYIRADAPELVALVAAISSAHIPNEQQREAVQVALAKWEALQ